ncbi:MAG TPA: hypothetical protein VIH00_10965 [Candidatus Limnocylindrales bacterium]
MTSAIACVVCTIDPVTTSLLLPVAQATVIAAPILMRERIARAVRRLSKRFRARSSVRS